MTRVEKLTPGPVANGTRWSATIESRGRPVDMEMEVTNYTRPTRLGSTSSMPKAQIHGAVTFEPDPAGTRMSWSWELQPKGLFRVVGPLIARIGRRQEAEIWASLKTYLESTAPPTTEK
jgi:hypothetical protein